MNPFCYLARFVDKTDPTASLKHLAYAAVVAGGCFWLTWDMIRGPITTEWNVAFGLLLGAVTTGKIVGAAVPSASGDRVSPGPVTDRGDQ